MESRVVMMDLLTSKIVPKRFQAFLSGISAAARAGRITCGIESGGGELGSVNSNLERHARQDRMVRITRCNTVAARSTQGHYGVQSTLDGAIEFRQSLRIVITRLSVNELIM